MLFKFKLRPVLMFLILDPNLTWVFDQVLQQQSTLKMEGSTRTTTNGFFLQAPCITLKLTRTEYFTH